MKLSIGEKIALLRKERNITQTELAEYLFLTPQSISRWEAGNGTPEVTLLPKIAVFFGVSIDELFGLTSLERAEELVCKYSVLRDDRSFHEAMECVNSQLQTIDAFLENSAEVPGELEKERDQLEAEKLHLWVQQGREAFRRAYLIADSFVEKTEGDLAHPWYLRMRLQRNQLSIHMGKGFEALAACKNDFLESANVSTLQIYLTLLLDLQRYEEILSIPETESSAKDIVFPASEKNLSIWRLLIHAAAEIGRTAFIEAHMPQILEVCNEQDEFDFLMSLLILYRRENQQEKLPAIKKRLLTLLPVKSYNKYFEEKARQQIEER